MPDLAKRRGRPPGRSPDAKVQHSVYLTPDTLRRLREDPRSPEDVVLAGLA